MFKEVKEVKKSHAMFRRWRSCAWTLDERWDDLTQRREGAKIGSAACRNARSVAALRLGVRFSSYRLRVNFREEVERNVDRWTVLLFKEVKEAKKLVL